MSDQPTPKIDNPWLQMLVSGLVTGGVAWGGMSIRMNNVESRAQEDRLAFSRALEKVTADFSRATERLTLEVSGLRWELQREREQRLTDRQGHTIEPPPAIFSRGRTFDK